LATSGATRRAGDDRSSNLTACLRAYPAATFLISTAEALATLRALANDAAPPSSASSASESSDPEAARREAARRAIGRGATFVTCRSSSTAPPRAAERSAVDEREMRAAIEAVDAAARAAVVFLDRHPSVCLVDADDFFGATARATAAQVRRGREASGGRDERRTRLDEGLGTAASQHLFGEPKSASCRLPPRVVACACPVRERPCQMHPTASPPIANRRWRR